MTTKNKAEMEPVTGEIVAFTPETMRAWLDGVGLPEGADDDDSDYAMALRIMAAPDAAAVLVRVPRWRAHEAVGEPFTIERIEWMRSRLKNTKNGRYVEMHGTDAKGEQIVVTSGSTQIMLQCLKLQELRALPVAVFVAASPTPDDGSSSANWLEMRESF